MTIASKIQEWLSPLMGDFRITTEYGAPIASGPDKGKPHWGVDLGAPEGTPVYAPKDAFVIRADNRDSVGGNEVQLGFEGNYKMLFAHLSRMVVQPNETVRAGEIIGYVGSTGTAVTGAHLHVEATHDDQRINPLDLFDPLHAADESAYSQEARRVPLQPDGNCPKGYHRRDDGFFGVGSDMSKAYCERDNPLGDVASGALDTAKNTAVAMAAIAQFFISLFDPANWAAWGALIGGAFLGMFGLYMVWQATS